MNPHDVLDDPTRDRGGDSDVAVAIPSSRPPSPWPGRLSWLVNRVWFWPALLTGVAGLYHVGRPELWRDELRSWSASSRGLGDLFHTLGNSDIAVTLYYLVLHFWMQVFGDSATSMRLPSVLGMAGSAAVTSLIGKRLYNQRVGITAGVTFAIIPAVTRFAQEVRPYALTILIATLSTLALLRMIEQPTRSRAVWYGLSITGLALMQIVAVPLLVAHAVGVVIWWRRERRVVVSWLTAAGIGLVLAAPVIYLSSKQYDHQVGSLPDATIGELVRLPARLFASSLFAGAVVVLAALALSARLRPTIFLLGWAVLPIGAIWAVSNLGHSYWMTRYMLFTLPAFALLIAAGLSSMRVLTTVATVAVLALTGVQDQRMLRWQGSHDQWQYPAYSGQPLLYSEAANIISDNLRPGDGVVFSARDDFWLLDIGLAYHLRNKPQPRDVLLRESAVERGDFWPIECGVPADCLRGVNRIWVVASAPGGDDNVFREMEPVKASTLRAEFEIEEVYHPFGIVIALMKRDSPVS